MRDLAFFSHPALFITSSGISSMLSCGDIIITVTCFSCNILANGDNSLAMEGATAPFDSGGTSTWTTRMELGLMSSTLIIVTWSAGNCNSAGGCCSSGVGLCASVTVPIFMLGIALIFCISMLLWFRVFFRHVLVFLDNIPLYGSG